MNKREFITLVGGVAVRRPRAAARRAGDRVSQQVSSRPHQAASQNPQDSKHR
jgi:hypothetical protein